MKRATLSRAFWKGATPVLLFLVLGLGLATLVIVSGRDPVIDAIDPSVVAPGDELVISGRHFGESRGSIRLAGMVFSAATITEWQDNLIRLTVPQGIDSGLLFVENERGSSEGTLVRTVRSVPRSSAAADAPGAPRIASLADTEVRVGDILVINGHNFGAQRRTSRVFFASVRDPGHAPPEPASVSYPVWTDEQVSVRVPAHATSGLVYIETPWGSSNPMRLVIERPAGELVRTDRTEVAVRYGALVRDVLVDSAASISPGAADIVLWLPDVPAGLGQASIRYLEPARSGAEAMALDGVVPIRFEYANSEFSGSVFRTVVADRYGIHLEINPARVSPVYEDESGFFEHYTQSTAEIPADAESIAEVGTAVRRGRASPYDIARAAYDWILDRMDYDFHAPERDALTGMTRAYGDDYTYATLYVAVLRAARIPSRVVGGVLATHVGMAYPHFWAEFFVPAVGWIPVDPALGDGAFPAGFPVPEDPVEFYFGNLDAHRLAFHHGYAENGPDRRDGTAYAPANPYTTQRRYAEAGPAVSAVTVEWREPMLLALRDW